MRPRTARRRRRRRSRRRRRRSSSKYIHRYTNICMYISIDISRDTFLV
jgi:hypothetical protein